MHNIIKFPEFTGGRRVDQEPEEDRESEENREAVSGLDVNNLTEILLYTKCCT